MIAKCHVTLQLVWLAVALLGAQLARCSVDTDLRNQFEREDASELLRPEDIIEAVDPTSGPVKVGLAHYEPVHTISVSSSGGQPPRQPPQTYGVIVDCGSSGTRAHIYHWDTEIDFSLQMLHDIEPLRDSNGKPVSKKVTPGLSKLDSADSVKRAEYIGPLIEFIAKSVPEDRHKFTVLYFMATAGMRLLDEQDRVSIMHDVKQYVVSRYRFARVETSVIEGSDEGMYQWISINAKDKRFLGEAKSDRMRTYAVIEMGGASLQVIYQVRSGTDTSRLNHIGLDVRDVYEAQLIQPSISREDKVPDHSVTLHSTTFLGFGVNSARGNYLDLLIHEQRNTWLEKAKQFFKGRLFRRNENEIRTIVNAKKPLLFEDPCLPKGYTTTEPLHKPVRMLRRAEPGHKTIGFEADDDNEPTFAFHLKGSGNYRKCKTMVVKLLARAREEKLHCDEDRLDLCTMLLLGEPFILFPRFDFVAISGFYYAFNNPLIDSPRRYNHALIVARTKRICEMDYKYLVLRFKDKIEEVHMLSTCFRAVFASNFLRYGLRMPEDINTLETISKINNDELDWTLGAVLDKSLAIEVATENDNPLLKEPDLENDDEETEMLAPFPPNPKP